MAITKLSSSSSMASTTIFLVIASALHLNIVRSECVEDNYISQSANSNCTMHVNGEAENLSGNSFKLASTICGFLIIPVAIVGIIGNLLTIYIFTRKHMACSINTLLAGLAGIDCLLLIIATPLFSGLALLNTPLDLEAFLSEALNYLILYAYPLSTMFQSASVWCMVVITMERFIAVLYPLKARIVCSIKNARLSLAAVVTLAILYNICRYWEYDISNDKLCNVLKNNTFYLRFYLHWLYFFVIFLIPFFVLSILNGLIINELKKARLHRAEMTRQETQEHKVAFMMVFVILVFFICNSLAFVLNSIEATQSESCIVTNKCEVANSMNNTESEEENSKPGCLSSTDSFYFLVDFNNLLIEINSSVNFLIYYAFSQRFRKQFRQFFQLLKKCGHKTNKKRSVLGSESVYDQELGALLSRHSVTDSPARYSTSERSYDGKKYISRAFSSKYP